VSARRQDNGSWLPRGRRGSRNLVRYRIRSRSMAFLLSKWLKRARNIQRLMLAKFFGVKLTAVATMHRVMDPPFKSEFESPQSCCQSQKESDKSGDGCFETDHFPNPAS
jgi:hypothetical protein